jgi:hypothetical protein
VFNGSKLAAIEHCVGYEFSDSSPMNLVSNASGLI